MVAMAAAAPDETPPLAAVGKHRNEVLLVGRIAAAAEERTLPSGDILVTWRLVVGRPPQPKAGGRRSASVDALECVAWRADVRRKALAWSVGDTVEIAGALRRRFWRGPTGPASRTEVEVSRGRRVVKGD